MNIPDYISGSLETIFGLKILQFFDADPGSGTFFTLDPGWKIRIRNKHSGSATLVPSALNCRLVVFFITYPFLNALCGLDFQTLVQTAAYM
jgi:hypothetical protein